MKRTLCLIKKGIACVILFYAAPLTAQNIAPYWSITGNTNALTNSKLGTLNAVPLRIMTKNTEWIRVDTFGRVGIGTTTPSQKLYVLGNSVITGNLGLGVTPTQKLHVIGNGLFTGSVGVGALSSGAKLNVVGSTTAGNGINVSGYSTGLSANATYTYGYGISASTDRGYGVYATSNYLGIYGYAPSGSYGTYGYSGGTGAYGSGATYGVYGYSGTGIAGVQGFSSSGFGVQGISSTSYGGNFESTASYALVASTNNGFYAGVFYGAVWTSVGYYTSDKHLKKDVREFSDAMSIINKLKPQDYLYKDDAKYASLNLPKGRHYGLIAQELEQVLPNLVSESPHQLTKTKPATIVQPTADGKPQPIVAETKETIETINIKAVNYVELIPIVVKAMQEQDIRLKEQELAIAGLKTEINELKNLLSNNAKASSPTLLAGYIKQNNPNPFNGNTVIKYFVPNDAWNAQIVVTDIKGSVIKTYKVPTGEGQLVIKKGELTGGTYHYTLYVNNNKIDTKRMIVLK